MIMIYPRSFVDRVSVRDYDSQNLKDVEVFRRTVGEPTGKV